MTSTPLQNDELTSPSEISIEYPSGECQDPSGECQDSYESSLQNDELLAAGECQDSSESSGWSLPPPKTRLKKKSCAAPRSVRPVVPSRPDGSSSSELELPTP